MYWSLTRSLTKTGTKVGATDAFTKLVRFTSIYSRIKFNDNPSASPTPCLYALPKAKLDTKYARQTQSQSKFRKLHQDTTVGLLNLTADEILDKLEANFKDQPHPVPDHKVKDTGSYRYLYVGTGQYFQHQENKRLIFLALHSLPDESRDDGLNVLSMPETILDCCLKRDDYDNFFDSLVDRKVVNNPITTGELDFIDKGINWNFGFSVKPSFSVFSKSDGLYISFVPKGKEKSPTHLRVCNSGLFEDIPLQDICNVHITLSSKPWCQRSIDLELVGNEILTILFTETEDEKRNLESLTIDSEWLVKCAGLLCLNLRKVGFPRVNLRMPSVLTQTGNPWVEIRHHAWINFINKYGNL